MDIEQVIKKTSTIHEPQDIPFPQADNFLRVINLCELLFDKEMTKEDITLNYDFDKRQSDYYYNAGKYLGLFEQIGKEICLTSQANQIIKLSPKEKQLAFVKLIIKHKVFKDALIEFLANGKPPTTQKIIEFMKNTKLNIGEDTMKRRSSTVSSWISWIIELVEEDV
jgi:hypothetical protein